MALPASWIETLFARLSVRYGTAFLRQYEDGDPEAIKADWAHVLHEFNEHPDGIVYALEHLPPERPPNALQFRDLCRAGPKPKDRLLGSPPHRPVPMPQAVREGLETLRLAPHATEDGTPAERCYARIMRLANEHHGGALTVSQRHMIDTMKRAGLLRRFLSDDPEPELEATAPTEATA